MTPTEKSFYNDITNYCFLKHWNVSKTPTDTRIFREHFIKGLVEIGSKFGITFQNASKNALGEAGGVPGIGKHRIKE